MFLRKIFSSDNKFVWVIIDLFIVIIGVYCAFLIQSYAEDERTEKEKDKVYTALKYELEIFRFSASEVALDVQSNIPNWEQKISNEVYFDFSDVRFIEPQYQYQIIEHSINIENSAIIDFELYDALQNLYVEIKKVEHTEQLLTEVAMKYHLIPEKLNANSKEAMLLSYENFNNFKRYVLFTRDRGSIMERIVFNSRKVLEILNARIDPVKRKNIERDLMKLGMPDFPNKNVAVGMAKKFFPNWSEEEITEIYNQVHGTKSTDSDSSSTQPN